MEVTTVLQSVGKIAGIGGIGLGVLLLIFRDVVRKKIFPNLTQQQAYRLISLIVILTFAIAALGIAAWVYINKQAGQNGASTQEFPKKDPTAIMTVHLGLIDVGDYESAYRQLSHEGRRRFPYELFKNTFETQRKPLGSVLSRKLHGATTLQQLPDNTKGAFAVATYIVEFEGGLKYLEAVTTISEGGAWRVLFHQLGPCAPPYCVP